MGRTGAVVAALAAVVIVPAAIGAELLHVQAVRYWSVGEVTRIVIQVNGDFTYHSERLHNPDRVFFDVFRSRPVIASKKLLNRELEDRILRRIRVAETLPGVTRVVLDLRKPVEVNASQLSNPNRLVVELRTAAAALPSATAAGSQPPPVAAAGPDRDAPSAPASGARRGRVTASKLVAADPKPEASTATVPPGPGRGGVSASKPVAAVPDRETRTAPESPAPDSRRAASAASTRRTGGMPAKPLAADPDRDHRAVADDAASVTRRAATAASTRATGGTPAKPLAANPDRDHPAVADEPASATRSEPAAATARAPGGMPLKPVAADPDRDDREAADDPASATRSEPAAAPARTTSGTPVKPVAADPDRDVPALPPPPDSATRSTPAAATKRAGETAPPLPGPITRPAGARLASDAVPTPPETVTRPGSPSPERARIPAALKKAAEKSVAKTEAAVTAEPSKAQTDTSRKPVARVQPPSRTPPAAAVRTDPGKAARRTSTGNSSLIRALGLKLNRVVLDPGHGGHDHGTVGGKGLKEKDLVLDIAKRLGKLIEERLGAEVVYTRTDDTFVPLEGRTALANDRKADLFLSIHANSSPLRRISGVETYYLNFTDSKEALDVASRENAASQKSISELRDVIQKIARHDKAEESREFAGRIQTALHAFTARSIPGRNRGVKKAPFVVLIGAEMPSVLAEIGFLSHSREEALLKKAEYRAKLAEALFRGVSKYAESLSHFQVASAQ